MELDTSASPTVDAQGGLQHEFDRPTGPHAKQRQIMVRVRNPNIKIRLLKVQEIPQRFT